MAGQVLATTRVASPGFAGDCSCPTRGQVSHQAQFVAHAAKAWVSRFPPGRDTWRDSTVPPIPPRVLTWRDDSAPRLRDQSLYVIQFQRSISSIDLEARLGDDPGVLYTDIELFFGNPHLRVDGECFARARERPRDSCPRHAPKGRRGAKDDP